MAYKQRAGHKVLNIQSEPIGLDLEPILPETPGNGANRPNQRSKAKILKRDKNTCQYCGRYGDTVDHVIPKSLGGSNHAKNLVCACQDCNTIKANNPNMKPRNWRR